MNAGDNHGAGALFAEGAAVVQAGAVRRLATRHDAIAWNAALPCSGRIAALKTRHDTVEVTVVLGDRGRRPCDGPGARVTAVVRVEEGKIVLWHQIEEPGGRRREAV